MTSKTISARRIVVALFILFLLVIPNNYRGHNVLAGGLTWERWAAHVFRNLSSMIKGSPSFAASLLIGYGLIDAF